MNTQVLRFSSIESGVNQPAFFPPIQREKEIDFQIGETGHYTINGVPFELAAGDVVTWHMPPGFQPTAPLLTPSDESDMLEG